MAQSHQGSQDPLRSPRWRWELAIALAEGVGQPFRPCHDAAVRSAKRFLICWNSCRGERDRGVVAAHMPLMYQTYMVYSHPRGGVRSAVEARVLAGESSQVIARKSGLPAAVIGVYEQLYFDVRDRLRHPDFILTEVLGPRLRGGEWDYDLACKFFGYAGGACVLDEFLDTCGSARRPTNPREVATFLDQETQAAVRRQVAVAARALAVGDRRTAAELIKAIVSGKDKEDEAPHDTYTQHVQAMLDSIPWTVGEAGAKTLHPRLAECDNAAVELRDDELLLVASGEEPPGLASLLKMKLPSPRPRGDESPK